MNSAQARMNSLWMRLAGHDQLHRAPGVGEQACQALAVVQQQVGALVLGETAREAQRQGVWIKNILRLGQGLRAGAALSQLPHQACARVVHEVGALRAAHGPQCLIAEPGDGLGVRVHCHAPPVFAAGLGPEAIGPGGIPRGHMHAVGDVADRDLRQRPAWVQVGENPAAHVAVQTADGIDAAAGARREIRHVERLIAVVRAPATQRQQRRGLHAKLGGVRAAVFVEQRDPVGIESRRHGGMGGKDIAGARRPQRLPEPDAVALHV